MQPNKRMCVSIHAPTWGATRMPLVSCRLLSVSIHAPTWGATPALNRAAMAMSFNPRAHVGRDSKIVSSEAESYLFQSTRPRGARPIMEAKIRLTDSFNPRAHVGRDRHYMDYILRKDVSIHAPTWGATSVDVDVVSVPKVSIHAPTWGATY